MCNSKTVYFSALKVTRKKYVLNRTLKLELTLSQVDSVNDDITNTVTPSFLLHHQLSLSSHSLIRLLYSGTNSLFKHTILA